MKDYSEGKWACLTSADPKSPHIIDCFYGIGSEFAAKEICKVSPSGEEGLANMRLICAAPELLEALQSSVSDLFYQIESKHGAEAASKYPAVVAARAAIAKALGK